MIAPRDKGFCPGAICADCLAELWGEDWAKEAQEVAER